MYDIAEGFGRNAAPRRAAVSFGVLLVLVLVYFFWFGPVDRRAKHEQFVVGVSATPADAIAKLNAGGFVRSSWAFNLALSLHGGASKIRSGGYDISKAMSAWEIAENLTRGPHTEWVVIPEGLRKEEIAEILTARLGWTDAQKEAWIAKDTAPDPAHTEGVYFPETYLIPKDESPENTAKRLRAEFETQFAPYAPEALKQNIKWDTLLKMASLLEREAAGKEDMPIVSAILWNRLASGMKLQVDATIQYARGKTEKGWWAPIGLTDRQIDSPYNTYLHAGLPPHPIANPGLEAIKAALAPAKTNCLYYIHDTSGMIHCTATYEEHQKNIEKYLRGSRKK